MAGDLEQAAEREMGAPDSASGRTISNAEEGTAAALAMLDVEEGVDAPTSALVLPTAAAMF